MSHLPSAHHKTSKHNSPHKTKIKVKLTKRHRFKFKPHQVNESSPSNQGTYHLVCQINQEHENLIIKKHTQISINKLRDRKQVVSQLIHKSDIILGETIIYINDIGIPSMTGE
jgi:hypothetical protein